MVRKTALEGDRVLLFFMLQFPEFELDPFSSSSGYGQGSVSARILRKKINCNVLIGILYQLGRVASRLLCIGKSPYNGSYNSLNIYIPLYDDRFHGAVGWLETNIAFFSIEPFQGCVCVVEQRDNDVSIFW